MISITFFNLIISVAILITTLAPVFLIYLWFKDWKDKKLW